MKSIAPTRYDDDGYDEDYPTGTCEACGVKLVRDAKGGAVDLSLPLLRPGSGSGA